MNFKYFYYMGLEDDPASVIRIKAKRDPSKCGEGPTCSGTWVAYGYYAEQKEWAMLPFPEVTKGTLNRLVPLGTKTVPTAAQQDKLWLENA